MRPTLSILIKNLILFFLLGVSLVFIFSKNIGFKEVNYLFGGIGILFILASCYEAYSISQINTSTIKIPYFTYGFLAKRFIKVIAFACCGIVLYYSGSMIKYLSFACFLISLTEIIVVVFRYTNNLSYIAFDNELLIISTNKLDIMHAGSVKKIQKRHGLTFIVDNTNKSFTLRTDILKDKSIFDAQLHEWIKKNNISDKLDLS
jgi:hypothetical protein